MLFDSARGSCYAGLQPFVTKRDGTDTCRKALYMLERCCCARLQPEVAKRNVEDLRKAVSEHMQCHSRAMREAGGCKRHCAGCAAKTCVAEAAAAEKVGGM